MNVLEDLGRSTTGFFSYAGGAATLLGESVGFASRLRIRVRETIDQAFLLGVQSWPIVVLTSLFTGMVFSFESAVQAVQHGFGNVVGAAVAFTMVRELGPMLSAVVVAGRSGAAISAELGSMVVTEQIEALQSLGLSPVRMLVVPRLVAMVVMMPILTIFADIVGFLGGMYIAQVSANIPYDSFLRSAQTSLLFGDVLRGLIKSVVFGIIIAVVGSYSGLQTRGGAAGVGKSTTGAVVTAIILIFIFNFALSYVLFR
jgi:phospholipid/cholesterol/gamma-HCH transport system permease protein